MGDEEKTFLELQKELRFITLHKLLAATKLLYISGTTVSEDGMLKSVERLQYIVDNCTRAIDNELNLRG